MILATSVIIFFPRAALAQKAPSALCLFYLSMYLSINIHLPLFLHLSYPSSFRNTSKRTVLDEGPRRRRALDVRRFVESVFEKEVHLFLFFCVAGFRGTRGTAREA